MLLGLTGGGRAPALRVCGGRAPTRSRWGASVVSFALSGCALAPSRAPIAGGADAPALSDHDTPIFENQAKRRGIDIRYRADLRRAKVVATMGGGVAAADYDNDGDVDLYLLTALSDAKEGTGKRGNALYRNRGDGTFEDVGHAAGVDLKAWSMGAVFADIDGDGLQDLYVTGLGPNHHYRNHGDGTFEDMGDRTGVANPLFGTGAAFADFDRDGDLDLILVNYLDTSVAAEMAAKQFIIKVPAEYQGQPSVFYENLGDGTFRDSTSRTGTDNRDGKGLGVRAFDADGDGLLDIYIANDTVPNKLYRNPGGTGGPWEDASLISGLSVPADARARAGMGIALGDAERDGFPDLFVTNFASEPNTLFRGLAPGLYTDDTDPALVERSLPYVAWGTAFFDYDLDGDEDLVVANGHLVPRIVRLFGRTTREEDKRYLHGAYKAPVQLFRNEGGRFVSMAGQAGDLDRIAVAARGLAVADIDDDGDLDVVVSARDQAAPTFVNLGPPRRHWLMVKLHAAGKNPFGIGARVEVEAGSLRMSRTLCAGSSYVGSEPPIAHFGLGPNARATRVVIHWPDGSQSERADVAADQVIEIRQ